MKETNSFFFPPFSPLFLFLHSLPLPCFKLFLLLFFLLFFPLHRSPPTLPSLILPLCAPSHHFFFFFPVSSLACSLHLSLFVLHMIPPFFSFCPTPPPPNLSPMLFVILLAPSAAAVVARRETDGLRRYLWCQADIIKNKTGGADRKIY